MRDLQPSDHGRSVSFKMTYEDKTIFGKVCYENNKYYVCQNVRNGGAPINKMGYKYGYAFYTGTVEQLTRWGVTEFKFINMTKQEIEQYKDFKKGDVLKDKRGETCEIIEQLGTVVFTKKTDPYKSVYCYFTEELYNRGWRLDVTPEEEEKPIVELSVAEIAAKLGISPEQLKVVDK